MTTTDKRTGKEIDGCFALVKASGHGDWHMGVATFTVFSDGSVRVYSYWTSVDRAFDADMSAEEAREEWKRLVGFGWTKARRRADDGGWLHPREMEAA